MKIECVVLPVPVQCTLLQENDGDTDVDTCSDPCCRENQRAARSFGRSQICRVMEPPCMSSRGQLSPPAFCEGSSSLQYILNISAVSLHFYCECCLEAERQHQLTAHANSSLILSKPCSILRCAQSPVQAHRLLPLDVASPRRTGSP